MCFARGRSLAWESTGCSGAKVPGKACLDGAGPQEGANVLVSYCPPWAVSIVWGVVAGKGHIIDYPRLDAAPRGRRSRHTNALRSIQGIISAVRRHRAPSGNCLAPWYRACCVSARVITSSPVR